jgi:hypothetical protein
VNATGRTAALRPKHSGSSMEKPLYFDPFGQTEFTPLAII